MSLSALLDELGECADALLLVGPAASRPREGVLPGAGWEVRSVSYAPRPQERDAVVLVAQDLADLRVAATGLSNYGNAHRVAVWFERPLPRLPLPRLRPQLAPGDVTASRAGGYVLLTFGEPVPARPVLLDLARAASPSRRTTQGWPRIGVPRGATRLWPPADPHATVAAPKKLLDHSRDSPPDVILLEAPPEVDPEADPEADAVSASAEPHHVLAKVPQVLVVEPDLTWSDLQDRRDGETMQELARRGPLSLGPLDVGVYNPIGFDSSAVGAPGQLRARADGCMAVTSPDGTETVVMSPQGRVSDADIPALRGLPGLTVDWQGTAGPQALARGLTTLAALGVPILSSGPAPEWAHVLLPEGLAAMFEAEVGLSEPLGREEHSIRTRRLALSRQGSRAWRRQLATEAGRQRTEPAGVSVLLVTRRPEMVPFALRQLSRQRGARFEVVLTTHGFAAADADLARFRDLAPEVPLRVVEAPASEIFGDVVTRAARAASADVLLKMDDDDWYSPDFVADLLLAREYAGATVTGCPPEFTFLEPLWLTTRRPWETETFAPFVAGGTIMIERSALADLGGFRSTRRHVDASLLAATLDAGGTVYRTHGLGYVLRRGEGGHTWDAGLGYFLQRDRVCDQWRGFRPSALLESDPDDTPSRPAAEEVTT